MAAKYPGLNSLGVEFQEMMADDDEVQVFLHLFVLLYADDTVILAEDEEALQSALNGLHQYCEEWHITVNTDKTKIVIFARGRVQIYPAFVFGNTHIEVVDSYIYLGVKFFYNGGFAQNINRQVSQAKRALNSLMCKAKILRLPADLVLELFDQTVLPVLIYGCEVWGFSNLELIETFY